MASTIDELVAVVPEEVRQTAKIIGKGMQRKSLTRMAKDSIMQFPMLLSSDISQDDCVILAKAIERQYASLAVSVFSLRSGFDRAKYKNVADYIKSIHNNDSIPMNLRAASVRMLESAMMELEGAMIEEELQHFPIPAKASLECWDSIEDRVDTKSLNELYLPYEKTRKILEASVIDIAGAVVGDVSNFADDNSGYSVDRGFRDTDHRTIHNVTTTTDKYGNPTTKEETKTELRVTRKAPTIMPAIVRNDKLTSLEPTLITLQVHSWGGPPGANGIDRSSTVENIVLGVKAMIRLIRSDLMVTNMCEAARDSNIIFKFIKWTKGEASFVKDFLLGMGESRKNANMRKDSSRWFAALLRRKKINNITRFFDNAVPPSTTIIITRYEAEAIREKTGVDLSNVNSSLKLIYKYYLLGFGIFDTESQMLQIMFDGDDDFSMVTLSSLKLNNQKDVDLRDVKAALQIGRM